MTVTKPVAPLPIPYGKRLVVDVKTTFNRDYGSVIYVDESKEVIRVAFTLYGELEHFRDERIARYRNPQARGRVLKVWQEQWWLRLNRLPRLTTALHDLQAQAAIMGHKIGLCALIKRDHELDQDNLAFAANKILIDPLVRRGVLFSDKGSCLAASYFTMRYGLPEPRVEMTFETHCDPCSRAFQERARKELQKG